MSSNDPGVPAYRFVAAMAAYAVGIYNLQLEEAVDQFQEDQVDSHTRRQFKTRRKKTVLSGPIISPTGRVS